VNSSSPHIANDVGFIHTLYHGDFPPLRGYQELKDAIGRMSETSLMIFNYWQEGSSPSGALTLSFRKILQNCHSSPEAK
jgi:hypothetical protein